MPAHAIAPLTIIEARVLGVLAEKQYTVPDIYPLSLNALVAGCNQKSSRDPVLELAEADVITAIDRLKGDTLIVESSGGRVARYAHNLQRVLQVPSEAVALLAVLMLRGPQTPGELRINSERLHRFSDVSSVEGYLHELADRAAGALVMSLPRAPGSREIRWAHLLCGQDAGGLASGGVRTNPAGRDEAGAALEMRIAALEAQVGTLKADVAALRTRIAGSGNESGA